MKDANTAAFANETDLNVLILIVCRFFYIVSDAALCKPVGILCQHMHIDRCTAPSNSQSPLLLQDPMAWAQRAISNNEFRCAHCREC
jgi:hypothetical protein